MQSGDESLTPERDRADPDGHALHARLLRGDPTATADLIDRYLEPLTGRVQRAFPTLDPDTVFNTVADLLLAFGQAPHTYDPDRLPLMSYLLMAAKGDVRNALDKAKRQQNRLAIVPLDTVELEPLARNSVQTGSPDPADALVRAADEAEVAQMLATLSEQDQEVVQLMMDGERKTERFAVALGLDALPEQEQRREVKRAKDRLKAHLRRQRHRQQDRG